MRKWLVIGIVIIVVVVAIRVVWLALSEEPSNILAIGNFVVLSLTLIVLIGYAYDTNKIAKVT